MITTASFLFLYKYNKKNLGTKFRKKNSIIIYPENSNQKNNQN